MSIVADIFIWLLVDTAFGFLFYATGGAILKVLTFGRYKMNFKNYAAFKDDKTNKVMPTIILGVGFYLAILALIALANR